MIPGASISLQLYADLKYILVFQSASTEDLSIRAYTTDSYGSQRLWKFDEFCDLSLDETDNEALMVLRHVLFRVL